MQHRGRRSLFTILILSAACLWISSVLTTRIAKLDVTELVLLRALPLPYWLGFVTLLAATIIWYFTPRTENVHHILVLCWTLYLFIAPELMEINGRVNDTYDLLLGITYLGANKFSAARGFGYAVFPNYTYFVSILDHVAGIDYYNLARIIAVSLHIVRAAEIIVLSSVLFRNRRQALLCSLLITAFLWIPGTHASPHATGFVLIVMLYAVAFNRHRKPIHRVLLLVLIFVAVLMTDASPALQALLAISVLSATAAILKNRVYPTGLISMNTATLFGVLLVSWLMYVASFVFNDVFANLPKLLANPFGRSVQYVSRHASVYRVDFVRFALIYILVLVVFVAWTAWRARLLQSRAMLAYPLLGGLPTIVIFFISPNSTDAPQRMLEYSSVFVAWFIVVNGGVRWRNFAFAVIALVVFPIGRYANEPAVIFPSTEIAGAKFLMDKIPSAEQVLAPGFRPSLAALADEPRVGETRNLREDVSPEAVSADWKIATMATMSIAVENMFRYGYGGDTWSDYTSQIDASQRGIVYSNGDFGVYWLDAPSERQLITANQ